MSDLTFLRLNTDWNAEPNAPELSVAVDGSTVDLSFYLNPFAYHANEDEMARLIFTRCSRWRRDGTNDEGWFAGRGRFAKVAPAWGEFYELRGVDSSIEAQDWKVISPDEEIGGTFCSIFAMRYSNVWRLIGG